MPFGLSEQDILDYLPVGELVPGATSWADLRRAGPEGSGLRFKAWLKSEHGADLSEKGLTGAAKALDHIPDEIAELLAKCERASSSLHRR